MRTLENITWEIDEDENIIILPRTKDSNERNVVAAFDKIRKNITLKTLAKKSIKDKSLMVMITKRDSKEQTRMQVGPSGSLYHTLVAQGTIKTHEDTIEL